MINFDNTSIPRDVATCPICDADLFFSEINETDCETGLPTQDGFHVGCTTEPEIDDDGWDEWHEWHYRTPYIDWLPVEAKVYKWLITAKIPTITHS